MKTPELLPCPFCGGPADFSDDGCIGYAYCIHCLARTDDYYSWRDKNWKENAARDWNDRVYPPEVQAAIEKNKPKEPIVKTSKYGKNYFCPNCDNDVSETYDCCSACGQRLNWENEE